MEEDEEDYANREIVSDNISKSDLIVNNDKKVRPNSINTNYESLYDKNEKDTDLKVNENNDNEENSDNKDRFKINLNYKEIIRSKSGMNYHYYTQYFMIELVWIYLTNT